MNYLRKACSFINKKRKYNVSNDTSNAHELRDALRRIEQIERILFKDIQQQHERDNIQFFARIRNSSGALRSTAEFSDAARLSAEVYFHHQEKAEIALTAGSSWYGGDYFEFGSVDLNTFRNMLSAYNICGMTRQHPDVRFYAFDIFGDPTVNAPEGGGDVDQDFVASLSHFTENGDQMKLHERYLDQHNLYRDQCFLVQGLFQNTLTNDFKEKYKAEKREIGFAFLDCNRTPSYKTVFDFIFDLMAEESYIYMDEFFQNPSVIEYYKQFTEKLRKERNIGSVYIRNAGGFGGLFRLYPLGVKDDKYDMR